MSIFNEYFWVLAATAVSTFSIAAFVLLTDKGYRKPLNRSFALFSLSVALWSGGVAAIFFFSTPGSATLESRLFELPVPFISVSYLFFVHILSGELNRKPFLALFFLSLAFGISNFSDSMIQSAVPKYGFRLMIQAGPYHFLMIIYFISLVIWAFLILLKTYLHSEGLKKRQLLYLLLGTGIGFTGGMSNLWVPYRLWIYPINPYATLSIILFVALTAYAIVRYRLMEIRILIRRTVLLSLIYAGLLAGAFPFLIHLHRSSFGSVNQSPYSLALEILLASTLLSLGPFLYAYFVRRSAFFQEETVAGLAHELKGPLAAIESALTLLSEKGETGTDVAAIKDYVDMIQRNALRLRTFIEDLLHSLSPEGKKALLKISETDISGLILQAKAVYEKSIEEKGLCFQFEKKGELAPLFVDSAKIYQVISNLLSNAVKFSDHGIIRLILEEKDGKAIISVLDEGRGILPEELPRLFDRFFQGEEGRRKKGTGIGLTIAKAWVDAHGGDIHAESAGPGKGSRFWFTIPV